MKKAVLSIQLSDEEFAKIRERDFDVDAIAEDAIRSVPESYREASLALAGTKWETIRKAVLRALPVPSFMFNKSSRISCGDSSAGAAGAAAMMTFSTGAGAGAAAAICGCAFNFSSCASFCLETRT